MRHRESVFTRASIVEPTLVQFRRTAATERFDVLAYCAMPDHVHLLVEGVDDDSDLRTFAKLAKQRSGGVFARHHRRPLWQEGYYDRVIRPDEDARAIARYILNNPVRAGLVLAPESYPFQGSDVWSLMDLLDSVRRY